MTTHRLRTSLLCFAVAGLLAACSQNPAEEPAQALLVRAQDAKTSQADPRAVSTLRFLESDMPGNIEIRGVTDADRDKLDDDGRVEVHALGDTACVTLPSDNESGKVDSGRC